MPIIEILNWVAIICGAILFLLMLLSLIGGLDLDFDLGDSETDAEGIGGIGIIKGALTFITVSSWMIKVLIATQTYPLFAIIAGFVAGYGAVIVLNWFLKLLLKNEHYVNWEPDEAINKEGKVYLRVPKEGSGIIQVMIKGALRELKAKSQNNKEIATGAKVIVNDFLNGFAIVSQKI